MLDELKANSHQSEINSIIGTSEKFLNKNHQPKKSKLGSMRLKRKLKNINSDSVVKKHTIIIISKIIKVRQISYLIK